VKGPKDAGILTLVAWSTLAAAAVVYGFGYRVPGLALLVLAVALIARDSGLWPRRGR
jgi:hypothetical protein